MFHVFRVSKLTKQLKSERSKYSGIDKSRGLFKRYSEVKRVLEENERFWKDERGLDEYMKNQNLKSSDVMDILRKREKQEDQLNHYYDKNIISLGDLYKKENIDPSVLSKCENLESLENVKNIQGGVIKLLGDCVLPPKPLVKPRYVMVTYAHGCCKETQKSIEKRGYEIGFDHVYSFGLEDLYESYRNKYRKVLNLKRGAGYWIWKAGAIQKVMDMEPISEDLYILYMDVDALFNDRPIHELFDEMKSKNIDIMTFQFAELNYKWTKRDTFLIMNADSVEYVLGKQTWASFLGFRNTFWSRFFLEEWMKFMGDDRIISDLPNTLKLPNYEGFRDHRHDQSVLSILILKYGIKPFPKHEFWSVGSSHE